MATVTTPTESAMAKRVYGDRYEKVPFHHTIITDMAPFSDAFRVGDTFRYLVEAQMEHGWTYAGSAGAETTLNDPIVGINVQTDIAAFEVHGRTRITTRAFEEAVGKNDQAFENATRQKMVALQTAGEFRAEHEHLYGQEGLFKVSAISSGVITVTDDTWCSTLAIRLVGAILEAWDGQTATQTQHNGDLTVSAVDLDAKTVTVTGTSSAVVANDWLYWKGNRTATAFNGSAGLHKLMTTTSGTLLGVNVATYPWFKPNVTSSFGRPTFLLLLKSLRKLVGRNTLSTKRDEKQNTKVLVPSVSFEILNSDLMTARRFDGSYSRTKGTTGVEAIEFYGQTGPSELMVHPLLRDGNILCVGPDNLFRVGTNELKWQRGPQNEGDVWTKVASKTSYEAEVYFIDAMAMFAPGRTVAIDGVTE